VTLSSTEAKCVALSDGSKETMFITNLLAEVTNVIMPSLLSENDTGAIFYLKIYMLVLEQNMLVPFVINIFERK